MALPKKIAEVYYPFVERYRSAGFTDKQIEVLWEDYFWKILTPPPYDDIINPK